MRARWVSEQPQPDPATVGRAIVASWWPMTYYWLSTIRLDANTLRLAEAIRLNLDYGDVQPSTPETYVTSVYRCSRIGAIRGTPLYEREHEGLVEAQQGHREALGKLACGNLKFNRGE